MAFGNYTPEFLLARSDSKNPATTCKGLTSSGRPCRRALPANSADSPALSPVRNMDGVVAILDGGAAAAFFCWQHKEQADILVEKVRERSKILPLQHKSSIDTLIERVGIFDLDDDVVVVDSPNHRRQDKNQKKSSRARGNKRSTLPKEWQAIQGPLMSVPEDIADLQNTVEPVRSKQSTRSTRRYSSREVGRSNVSASWSCCIRADDDEVSSPPRKRDRYEQARPQPQGNPMPQSDIRPTSISSPNTTPIRRKPVRPMEMQQRPPSEMRIRQIPISPQTHLTPTRPILQQSFPSRSPPNSQTATLLSLIPPHLSPNATSALLSELSRPISEADEDGYIYIFWLTPESDISKPDDEVASSLLDFDSPSPTPSPHIRAHRSSLISYRPADHDRRTQALKRYASTRQGPSQPEKILLKIGRAANVHRRLSQWTKQCGQNITLIRFYPYQRHEATAEDMSVNIGKRTVPHVHRVERLIHLELAEQRVTDKGECQACGKTHKEWFEVEASKQGLKTVDEVVRRWVDWAERTR